MKLTSILAVYLLFWMMSLFIVLPFGVRTSEEVGAERVPGHADSAPHSFSFWRVALRTTIVSAIFFALFYANYVYGWVEVRDIDWLNR
ncbi:DUF1467 family protein [Sphingosinicella sp. LHD-64]|uniref:DUF1467 family protein n=1 Tax=Sphingosinicella sp. LHD-64 TaxID=3072139 RepID=UPI00280E2478|nr:DUF1467 family protein [Sphingosinicella sp. LHD-64]MDQ8754775.1 DUF1467 family protein [Sphingosinicella sp. LHD-64]